MIVVSHVWPGITPFNVWDLTLRLWMRFAHAADRWQEDRDGSR